MGAGVATSPHFVEVSRSSAFIALRLGARPFVSAWLDALATGGHCVSLPLSSGPPGRGCLRIRCSATPRVGVSGASSVPYTLAGIGRLIRTAVSGACVGGVSAFVAAPGHTRKLSRDPESRERKIGLRACG